MLYNIFLPVLQLCPVSTIPTLLHSHSSIYHPHSILFFSQYFIFPRQYHSTIAPFSFIHLPPMLYNVFLPAKFSFPCQYHSTIAPYSSISPYSFIHLPPTLYNVFLLILQFSPVSIIPPLLHSHSSIYHPHSVLFFSQYLSFPCQYHSTIAPYSSIHLTPTLYNVFLPVLQFPLSVPFHHCSTLIHPSNTHTV